MPTQSGSSAGITSLGVLPAAPKTTEPQALAAGQRHHAHQASPEQRAPCVISKSGWLMIQAPHTDLLGHKNPSPGHPQKFARSPHETKESKSLIMQTQICQSILTFSNFLVTRGAPGASVVGSSMREILMFRSVSTCGRQESPSF
jgi:hypothetical protein